MNQNRLVSSYGEAACVKPVRADAARLCWHAGSRILLAISLLAPIGCAPERAPDLTLSGPERIAAERTFERRTIRVDKPSDDGALVIETDGVVLDLAGGDLVGAADATPPDEYVGRGIVVRGAKDVTIRNANVRGFKVGIYAEDAPGIKIENCDVSRNYRQRLKSTPEREHLDDWLWGHENDKNEWLRYGAGVYVLRCDKAEIRGNRSRNGQNGICLVRCDGAVVVDNDMSFMSGWGLAMWRCNHCQVLGNRFDYCVRGYSHGVYARGQDSTGILVYEQCSDNLFAYNSATHGGDGFFLYAGNETVKETGEGGCNRNVLYANDFSHAVANGIEATFSDRNVFAFNRLNHCRHGIWAGYSRNTHAAVNLINDCQNGVSIEHGIGNRIEVNGFDRCGVGVRIWWDDDEDLLASPFGQQHGGRSENETIRGNTFAECETAVWASASKGVKLSQNIFTGCKRVLHVEDKATLATFQGNLLDGGRIDNQTDSPLIGRENYVPESVSSSGLVEWRDRRADRPDWRAVKARCGASAQAVLDEIRPRLEAAAEACGDPGFQIGASLKAPLPGVPQGKENIFIDEWGPHDFAHAKVHPSRAFGWGSTAVQVLGPQASFEVGAVEGDVVVTPRSGVAPAAVAISRNTTRPGVSQYAVHFKVGEATLAATGVLMQADWDVVFYRWSKDVDPRSGEDAWQRIVSAEPIHRERTGRLDFVWGSRGPRPGLSGDYFAAVATTTMELPAGRWTFRTISDDGVRVYLDGRRVIDNWTWHVPTEDTAVVDLTAGRLPPFASEGMGHPLHEIRIEYFEIDGYAQLQFFMEPGES